MVLVTPVVVLVIPVCILLPVILAIVLLQLLELGDLLPKLLTLTSKLILVLSELLSVMVQRRLRVLGQLLRREEVRPRAVTAVAVLRHLSLQRRNIDAMLALLLRCGAFDRLDPALFGLGVLLVKLRPSLGLLELLPKASV